jgi:hypothetical protein
MAKNILRVTLTVLALVMLFASSLNLSRAQAQNPAALCADWSCRGGTDWCAVFDTSGGGTLTCYWTMADDFEQPD